MNGKGMYQYIKTPQMWALLDSLEKLHGFARQFNSNTEQRVVLMKAGTYELAGESSRVEVVGHGSTISVAAKAVNSSLFVYTYGTCHKKPYNIHEFAT